MLRGRRFRALAGLQRFFVVYEAESPEVFGGEETLRSVNNPLPRTLALVGGFRDTVRTIHRIVDRYGDDGGTVASLRVRAEPGRREALGAAAAELSAKALALLPDLVGATVFREDDAISSLGNTERTLRGGDGRCDLVVVLEGIDALAVDRAAMALSARMSAVGGVAVEVGVYAHISTKYHGTDRDF